MTAQPFREACGPHAVDDLDLGAAISSALLLCAAGSSMVLEVSHGIVTLEGEVDTRKRAREIESAVRRFRGVRKIVNRITVREAPRATGESRADRPASESPH
jgi:osmotically-inducible protein OsmY